MRAHIMTLAKDPRGSVIMVRQHWAWDGLPPFDPRPAEVIIQDELAKPDTDHVMIDRLDTGHEYRTIYHKDGTTQDLDEVRPRRSRSKAAPRRLPKRETP